MTTSKNDCLHTSLATSITLTDCNDDMNEPESIAGENNTVINISHSFIKNIASESIAGDPSHANKNFGITHQAGANTTTTDKPVSNSSANKATNLSLAANIMLFLAKCVAFYLTFSLAVIASLLDSAIDLVSQYILFSTERSASHPNIDKYPVGKTRLEPVGILIVSILMVMTAIAVVREAIDILARDEHFVHFSIIGTSLMSAVIVTKFALWIYCRRIKVPVAEALAQDHINDVFSNSIALLAVVLASEFDSSWSWIDPAGAIVISVYIIYSWYGLGKDEIRKLVGKVADDEMLVELREICDEHCTDADLDVLVGYHIGRNILVEVEMIMDSETSLRVSHDVCIELQQKLEKYEYVERAFVHCDYERRECNGHKLPMLS